MISEDAIDKNYLLMQLNDEYEIQGLTINTEKTEYLSVGDDSAVKEEELKAVKMKRSPYHLGVIVEIQRE